MTLADDRKSSQRQQQAYDEIKRLIVSGQAAPGAFLSERRLGEQLGMSKTPVHAALERLEAEGYVAISPQQGVVVRELSVQDVVEYYEMRQAIESFAVQKIAGRLSSQQLRELRKNLTSQRKRLKEKAVTESVKLDVEFHTLLCRFAVNSQMVSFMERSHSRIHQVIVRAWGNDPTRLKNSLDEHRSVVEAIAAGDGAQASRLLVSHLESGKQSHLHPTG